MAKKERDSEVVCNLSYGTLTVNEIELVDTTKIMISLCKAKQE